MSLTISTTHAPATDLGYLLHKHPDRCQSFDLGFGKAHVFYPAAGEDRCTAALLLDVDPVGLVRNRRGPAGEGFHLRQYVNDRPFIASSLMSVAIARVFGTALSGRCEQRSELGSEDIYLADGQPERHFEIVQRRAGRTLGDTLALAEEWKSLDYIQIVTFNDWNEGTQIEPAVEYGNRELDTVKRFVDDGTPG